MFRTSNLIYLLLLVACTKQPVDHQATRSKSGGTSTLIAVEPSSDAGGVVTANIEPSGETAQQLAASIGSPVAGARVTFPAGALAVGGAVTIEESASIATDQLLTLIAGVDASAVTTSAVAVQVDIRPASDPAGPIELSIPAPDAAGLQGGPEDTSQGTPANLAVIYHAVQHGRAGTAFSGILFADKLKVADGTVTFKFGNFGAFQAVLLADPTALRSQAQSAREVVSGPLSKIAEAALGGFDWGLIEAQRGEKRTVVISFAGQSDDVADCVAFVDDDQARPFLATRYFGAQSYATITVPGENKIDVSAQIACFDSAGRSVVSPWSGAVSIGAGDSTSSTTSDTDTSTDTSTGTSTGGADEQAPAPGGDGALTVGNITAFGAKLTWEKAEDDHSPASKLKYQVYRSIKDNIATLADLKKNGTATGAPQTDAATSTIGGLAEATAYWLNVVVTDAAGNAAAYVPRKITTADASPPTMTTSELTLGAATVSAITVSWTAAADNVSAAAALKYRLYYASSNSIGSVATIKANGTPVGSSAENAITTKTATGLAEATAYYLNVLVTDEAGKEAVYTPLLVRTADATAPTAGGAGAISSDTIRNTSIDLSWTAASDNSGSAAVTYRVYKSSSSNLDTLANTLANGTAIGSFASATSKTVTGLSELATYYFNVVAQDAAGNQSAYAQAMFSTVDKTAPVPGNAGALTSSSVTGTSASIDWTAASDNGTVASGLKYSLYKSANADSAFDTIASVKAGELVGSADQTGITSQVASGLTSATKYRFNLLVKDAAGNESVYHSVAVTTADVTAPTVANGTLSVTDYSTQTVSLSWTAASDATTTDPGLLTYQVFYTTNSADFSSVSGVIGGTSAGAAQAGVTTKQVTGLTPGTTYYLNVVVRDQADNAAIYSNLQRLMPTVLGNGVQPVSPTLTNVKTVIGTGSSGSFDATPGTSATIQDVKAMTTDGVDLYFAQGDGAIRKYDTTTTAVTTLLAGVSPTPLGLTCDGSYLYIATGHSIRRYSLSTAASIVIAGDETTGGYIDDDGTAARFDSPTALAADASTLYIWDDGNALIRKMSLTSPYTVTTVAGSQGVASVDDNADTFATLIGMTLAKDVAGSLYVAEYSGCVRQVTISSGDAATKAGDCTTNGLVNNATGTSARFETLGSVTSTGSALYVVDAGNHAVRSVTNLASTHTVATLSGDGSSGIASDTTAGAAKWDTPTQAASTANGVFVYDGTNNVIRRIGP